jgi:hypothetical protein
MPGSKAQHLFQKIRNNHSNAMSTAMMMAMAM